MADIADRLKEVFKAQGLSIAEAAERSGIPYRSMQNYVSASPELVQKPGAEALMKLQQSFGVSIDWLLTGEGEPYGGADEVHPRRLELEDYIRLREQFTNFDEVFQLRGRLSFRPGALPPANRIPLPYLAFVARKSLKASVQGGGIGDNPLKAYELDALAGRDPDELSDEEVMDITNRAFVAFVEAQGIANQGDGAQAK